jgi:hypothetical protein
MIRPIIVTLALAAATASPAWAYRVLEQLEQAYELQLGQVRLPDRSTGSVIFTACDTCRTISLRVSDATVYSIDETLVSLTDLNRRADSLLATIDGPKRAGVFVFYDPTSLRVTRLILSPYDGGQSAQSTPRDQERQRRGERNRTERDD